MKEVLLCPPPVSVMVHVDATPSGWGGYTEARTVQGVWFPSLQYCLFNFLGMRTAILVLL